MRHSSVVHMRLQGVRTLPQNVALEGRPKTQ